MSTRPQPAPQSLFSKLLAHPSDQPLVHVQRSVPQTTLPTKALVSPEEDPFVLVRTAGSEEEERERAIRAALEGLLLKNDACIDDLFATMRDAVEGNQATAGSVSAINDRVHLRYKVIARKSEKEGEKGFVVSADVATAFQPDWWTSNLEESPPIISSVTRKETFVPIDFADQRLRAEFVRKLENEDPDFPGRLPVIMKQKLAIKSRYIRNAGVEPLEYKDDPSQSPDERITKWLENFVYTAVDLNDYILYDASFAEEILGDELELDLVHAEELDVSPNPRHLRANMNFIMFNDIFERTVKQFKRDYYAIENEDKIVQNAFYKAGQKWLAQIYYAKDGVVNGGTNYWFRGGDDRPFYYEALVPFAFSLVCDTAKQSLEELAYTPGGPGWRAARNRAEDAGMQTRKRNRTAQELMAALSRVE